MNIYFLYHLLIALVHAMQNTQNFEQRCNIEIEAEGVCIDEAAC